VYHVDDQLVELAMEALYTVTNHLFFQFHKYETLCQAILKCLEVYVQHNPPGNCTIYIPLNTQNMYILYFIIHYILGCYKNLSHFDIEFFFVE